MFRRDLKLKFEREFSCGGIGSVFDCCVVEGSIFPDGVERFAVGSMDRTLRIFHTESGEVECKITDGWFIYSMTLNLQKSHLIYANHEGYVKFLRIPNYEVDWKIKVGKGTDFEPIWRVFCLRGFRNTFACIYNPFQIPVNGTIVICQYEFQGNVRKWYLQDHQSYVWSIIQPKSDEFGLITGGGDGHESDTKMRYWDIGSIINDDVYRKRTFKGEPHDDRVVSFSSILRSDQPYIFDESYNNQTNNKLPQNELIISLSRDASLKIWNLRGSLVTTIHFPSSDFLQKRIHPSEEDSSTFLQVEKEKEGFYSAVDYDDGNFLIGGQLGSIFLFNCFSMSFERMTYDNETQKPQKQHDSKIYQIRWLPTKSSCSKKKKFLTVSNDSKIYMYRLLDPQVKMIDSDFRTRMQFLDDHVFVETKKYMCRILVTFNNLSIFCPFIFL